VRRGAVAGNRIVLVLVIAALFVPVLALGARAQGPRVLVAEIAGAIDQSTLEYMTEAVNEAVQGGYAALVIRFDTPGGALAETEAIASLLLSARIPVLGWVGPVGAHAWSAGTILLQATDVAAMAPGATIGSVQPVVIGPSGFEPVTDPKIVEAVVESLRAKIVLHVQPPRNESLARRFVVDNLNLNASDAVRLRATEFVAASLPEFLALAHGQRVVIQEAGAPPVKDLVVSVAGAELVEFQSSLRVRFLGVLSDPLISSLFLILGIYLLIFGLSAPGHGAEIAGIIVLLLALVGLGFSVDPIAILLLVIGVIFIVVELKTPGFGAFGIAGILAILIGAVFVAPLRPPQFVVSPDYQVLFLIGLLAPSGAFGGFLLFALYKVMEIRRRKPAIGAMVGDEAVAVDPIRAGETGYVQYTGELWQAIPKEDLAPDAKVYIHAVDGIVLRVSALPPPPPPESPWRRRLGGLLGRRTA